ncbi:RDD family protein [Desulfosporosinus sp. Sb-LF]|uniref:RDD family protein n=1 Tax=Desulfosporosinus sp. Sb-LF TaxID=2560027 RepID=UPI00107F490A|nr:RDD family protein [Desulfosporosinus sp. Sb-LF]TGE31085.1 hypothetical protein E4K68_19165 [Desulfosporosinus sp. Sb-LF]
MEQPSRVYRLGSLVVDFTTIFIIILLLANSVSYPTKIIAIFIPLVYFPILHTILSRTIGDMVLDLKVVDQQGNNIGFRLAINRFFSAFKYSIFSLILSNLLVMFYFFFSGDLKEISFDYEEESQTYLVSRSPANKSLLH